MNVFISIHNTYIVLSTTIFPMVSEFTDPLDILRLTHNHTESIQYCFLQYCYISQTLLFPHLLSSVLKYIPKTYDAYQNHNSYIISQNRFIRNFK